MKRYWPFILALFCWLLVLAVPTTRLATSGAWDEWSLLYNLRGDQDTTEHFFAVSPEVRSLLARYPNDKSIETYAGREYARYLYSDNYGRQQDFDYLAKRYPDDPYIVVLQIRNALVKLKFKRPVRLTLPPSQRSLNGISEEASPDPGWKRFIALAKRGQKLEPDNTYFDWMLLYGLYATHRDGEMPSVLRAAAHKPRFNTHSRDDKRHQISVLKRLYGSALPAIALYRAAEETTLYTEQECFRVVAYLTMDLALEDRSKHPIRALETPLDLMKLSRVMRHESSSYFDVVPAFTCEWIAMTNSANDRQVERIMPFSPLSDYRKHPNSLYRVAKSRGRSDIARAASDSWQEQLRWEDSQRYDYSWIARNDKALYWLTMVNHWRARLLKTLPLTALLGLLFGIVALRFPVGQTTTHLFRRGASAGNLLLVWAVILAVFSSINASQGSGVSQMEFCIREMDVLKPASIWFYCGLPLVLLAHGLYLAGQWQSKPLSFKERLKKLAAPSADGLARLDMGWAIGAVLRLTYWIILLAIISHFALYPNDWHVYGGGDNKIAARWIMIIGLALSLITLAFTWGHRPRRNEALRLGFRHIFQISVGYLAGASIAYAIISFAMLPLNLQVERDFEAAALQGEFQMRLKELGLK